eukprot:8386098-Pyramimonas_sp.AAC.1
MFCASAPAFTQLSINRTREVPIRIRQGSRLSLPASRRGDPMVAVSFQPETQRKAHGPLHSSAPRSEALFCQGHHVFPCCVMYIDRAHLYRVAFTHKIANLCSLRLKCATRSAGRVATAVRLIAPRRVSAAHWPQCSGLPYMDSPSIAPFL